MDLNNTKTLSALTLELYRACREMAVDAYQRWALDRVKRHVPFDAGLWASGMFQDGSYPVIHNIVLVNRPLEMMADYERVKHLDQLARQNAENHGVACIENGVDEDAKWPPEIVAYVRKWRIVHALACHIVDPLTRLATAVAFWREERARPFSEDERQFFENTMPHLIETYGINRIAHMERAARPRSAAPVASAVVDRFAQLQVAPQEFQRLLLTEWSDWSGAQVPEPIRQLIDGNPVARFVGERIAVRATRMSDVFLVQARRKCPADGLSERELDVARLCAGGMTYKAIAQRLDIAPGTVRNHISSIFAKLGIGKQSELAAALRDFD